MSKCNPYGYATDAGPRHVMGGRFGPEYAGHKMLHDQEGTRGLGVCDQGPGRSPADATRRVRMTCPHGHTGPIMNLCDHHFLLIQSKYSQTCTRCVMPEQSLQLEREMEMIMRDIGDAAAADDRARVHALQQGLNDKRQQMDELMARGIIKARVPLTLVEVS